MTLRCWNNHKKTCYIRKSNNNLPILETASGITAAARLYKASIQQDSETSSQKTFGSDEQSNCSKQSLNEEEPSLDTSEPEGVRQILTERQPLPSTKYVKAARSNSIRSSQVFDPMRPSDSSGKRWSKRKRQRS